MRKADNLPPYCAVVKDSRSLNFLDPSGPAWPVMGVLTCLHYKSGFVHGNSSVIEVGIYDTSGKFCSWPYM